MYGTEQPLSAEEDRAGAVVGAWEGALFPHCYYPRYPNISINRDVQPVLHRGVTRHGATLGKPFQTAGLFHSFSCTANGRWSIHTSLLLINMG